MSYARDQKIKTFGFLCLAAATIVHPVQGSVSSYANEEALEGFHLTKRAPVKTAVIDTYFDPNSNTRKALTKSTHIALANYSKKELRYVARAYGDDHANHVASIVDNWSQGNAKLKMISLGLDPATKDAKGTNGRIIAAIDEAIKSNVDFINISLRLSPNASSRRDEAMTKELEDAFLKAKEAGIGIIKSAGNDGRKGEMTGSTEYTKSLARLLKKMDGNMLMAVATNNNKEICEFSNGAGIGAKYIVSAPGYKITAGGAGKQPVTKSGTSMAAPAVTGLASYIKSQHTNLSSNEVLKAIRLSAHTDMTPQTVIQRIAQYGSGSIDPDKALQKAATYSAQKD